MFSIGLPQPLKDSVPIRAFCVFRFFMLFMIKVLWTIMRINTKGINTFVKQTKMLAKRGLGWNTLLFLDNLIGSHHPEDILIKVLSWFCLERDRGKPSACVTEIREQSSIASIRKTDIIFKVSAGAAFQNPWSPDLPCLSGLLHMTLSWVGTCVLAPGISSFFIL